MCLTLSYKENSIKNIRGEETRHQLATEYHKCTDCKNILVKNCQQDQLLVSEWKKISYREKLQGNVLYVTVYDKCYRIKSQRSSCTLQCSQEEANGQLLLHAVHAASECVVCSEDTDVFIMCLARIRAPLFQSVVSKTREELLLTSKKLQLLLVLMSESPCWHACIATLM